MECIFVLGWDGYIGNALTQKLLSENYNVIGIDNYFKRHLVEHEMNSHSAVKIDSINKKQNIFKKTFPGKFKYYNLDIAMDFETLDKIIELHKPAAIVNLAHNPSGPFSMKSQDASNYVLYNNIISTNNLLWSINRHCNDCHLISLGTTGEYDHYNNIDIEEGYFSIEYNNRKSNEMIYPRRPGSIYHTSKVANTYLIDLLSKNWNLRCTDIMQSVVFGLYTQETDLTKVYSPLHTDEAFGTVINRFIVQAKLKKPLTVYGEGKHQRGFLSLNDSVQALMIAIKNPCDRGRPRVWNQLSEWHSMNDITELVKNALDQNLEINHIDSPRKEQTSEHYYNYKTDILKSFGYIPSRTIKEEIKYVYDLLDESYISDLTNVIQPKIIFSECK